MGGEFVLTAASLTQLGVFYAEVEATNTVTSGTATTVVEIHVSEQEPPATGAARGLGGPQGGLPAAGMPGPRPA